MILKKCPDRFESTKLLRFLSTNRRKSHPAPAWLRRAFGDQVHCIIRSVNLSNRETTDSHFVAISRLDQLIMLHADNTDVTDSGISRLSNCRELRFLSLSGCAVTDASLTHIKALKQLEYLNLHGTEMTDRAVEELTSLQQLKVLVVSKEQLFAPGNEAIKETALAALSSLPNLKLLAVRDAELTPDSLEALQMALPGIAISFKQLTVTPLKEPPLEAIL